MKYRNRIIPFITISLIAFQSSFGDTTSQIDIQIDSLKNVRNSLILEIKNIDSRIDSLEGLQYQNKISKMNYDTVIAVTKMDGAFISQSPSFNSKIIQKFPSKTKLKVIGYSNSFWKIDYNNQPGYIYDNYVNIDNKEEKKKYFSHLAKMEKEKSQRKAEEAEEKKREALEKEKEERRIFLEKCKNNKNKIEAQPIWIKSFTANVRELPSTNSSIIDKLEQGNRGFVQEIKEDWMKIFYDGPNEIASYNDIMAVTRKFKSGWVHNSVISKVTVKELTEDEKRRQIFVQNHPNLSSQDRKDILAGNIRIGMTREMVIASWGEPKDINRTVGTYGVHEQFIYYSGTYVYIQNGKLTSWQD